MQIVEATPKITTRIRPVPQTTVRPVVETLTTAAGICPFCGRETRVGICDTATVYDSCLHFRGVQQQGPEITVLFDQAAA